jgi:hypothetical protein
VVLATNAFEESGLGRRIQHPDGRWRRGRLVICEVRAENPLTGEGAAVVRQGDHQVRVPDTPVTHAQIMAAAEATMPRSRDGAPARATLRFHTPTRLIQRGHLVTPDAFRFRYLIHRLIDRLEALSRGFTDTPLHLDVPALLEAADRVAVVDNRLSWEEVSSYSTRRRTTSPTSGLLGSVTVQATDWAPFWPWLLWGRFVHVGKDAVKGNGIYSLDPGPDQGVA